MNRREFITLLGSAAAWPIAARAQQTAMPVIGFLSSSRDAYRLGAFRQGLKDAGFIEGENVVIEYRWADDQVDRLPALATELVRRQVAAIGGIPPAFAAKAATARAMGLQIQVLNASTIHEIDAAFATLVSERPDALLVGPGAFLQGRRAQLAQLAAHHSVPTIHQDRLYAEVGGLMSYGASLTDGYRHVGVYTGRILKGAKPADLPVVQSTKFELVINASTARMLGLTVPEKLLVAADEVIE